MMAAARAFGLVLILAAAPVAVAAGPQDVTVVRGTGTAMTLTPAQLAALPAVRLTVSFGTDHGTFRGSFSGPLLWRVLQEAGAVDTRRPRQQASETILVTGRDGYAAALAVGEIAPAFEGKTVILAESMNGRALGPDHLRLVVPGDAKGGRSVRDVVRIAVSAPAAAAR